VNCLIEGVMTMFDNNPPFFDRFFSLLKQYKKKQDSIEEEIACWDLVKED